MEAYLGEPLVWPASLVQRATNVLVARVTNQENTPLNPDTIESVRVRVTDWNDRGREVYAADLEADEVLYASEQAWSRYRDASEDPNAWYNFRHFLPPAALPDGVPSEVRISYRFTTTAGTQFVAQYHAAVEWDGYPDEDDEDD